MNDINFHEREYNRIIKIANEYRQKGYEVVIQPSSSDLPNFLSGYRPDVIAKNDNESVIIEVTSHLSSFRESQMSSTAEIVERQPGWRFEFVMTNPKGNTLISSGSRLPSTKEVSKRLIEAKKLVSGANYEAAIALAWSAAEGLLRLIGESENIVLDRQSSSYVIKKIYSLGLLDNASYEELYKLNKIRNSIIHGLVESDLRSSIILNFIELIRKILKRYRSKLKMGCTCPVCKKRTSSVGTLFSHLVNIHDERHRKWLESYCKASSINFMKVLVDRAKGIKNANKPLTDQLKRDFCEDC